jgi:hypothetical protein
LMDVFDSITARLGEEEDSPDGTGQRRPSEQAKESGRCISHLIGTLRVKINVQVSAPFNLGEKDRSKLADHKVECPISTSESHQNDFVMKNSPVRHQTEGHGQST